MSFFFSSRRRHTRCSRDWSSDVCSSDLLVSAGFLEGFYYKPRIDYDLLAKHSKGLIALSACLRGPVTEAVVDQKYDQARENAYRLRDVFGKGNFFLEIQDQGLPI